MISQETNGRFVLTSLRREKYIIGRKYLLYIFMPQRHIREVTSMFTEAELRLVDATYFTILRINSFCINIRSKCTRHFWHITVQEYGHIRRFELWHRHKAYGAYHRHGHAGSLEEILLSIKQHDAFQLNGRQQYT